jgi:hypothetical protein
MSVRFLMVMIFACSSLTANAKRVYCHTMSLLIRMGDRKDCYQGHVGVAVNNEYYDWGPSNDSRSDFLYYLIGDKGEPYTDLRMNSNPKRKNLATAADIRRFLSGSLNPCAAYEVRARITHEQAHLLKYYWDFIYEEKPYFHVLKNQCTNIAFGSLKYAGLLQKGRVVLYPKTLLARAQKELVSSCGADKGKPAQVYTLKK